ncbi:hypothetical protein CERZMDRAFT_92165 [Cercospora zeae-maydis SCOH1-5]|uniref:Uncharacterized protein n=1 Tax=Cercospora zeae-maydis SCOH1-5 TaxID=717836 RepID=A0A6A6FW93_9PEZI|nr:hypothetical protein CERZMDRAFT_92165 [Cercospora zeae-maydis SCOH1-5]
MAVSIQKVWKGTSWSCRRGSINIDNVRLSTLHMPSQHYHEGAAYRYHSNALPEITQNLFADSKPLPTKSIRHERGVMKDDVDRIQTEYPSTTELTKWRNKPHPTSNKPLPRNKPLLRNKPLPSVSTAPDRALTRIKHKIVRHHRRWVGVG